MTVPLTSTLRVAIPGAGMAGLAAALALAHKGFEHIDVYEAASDLGFVGAGIQVAPNLSRVLQNLGVWEFIKDDVVEMKEASIRGAAFFYHCFKFSKDLQCFSIHYRRRTCECQANTYRREVWPTSLCMCP